MPFFEQFAPVCNCISFIICSFIIKVPTCYLAAFLKTLGGPHLLPHHLVNVDKNELWVAHQEDNMDDYFFSNTIVMKFSQFSQTLKPSVLWLLYYLYKSSSSAFAPHYSDFLLAMSCIFWVRLMLARENMRNTWVNSLRRRLITQS